MSTMMKRILSIVLCCVMLIGIVPANAFAADDFEIIVVEENSVSKTVGDVDENLGSQDESIADEGTETEEAVVEGTTAPTESATEATEEVVEEEVQTVFVETRSTTGMVAAAIFASDIHEGSTELNGSGTSALKSILSTIGTNGVSYDTMGFVGDTYSDIAGTMEAMTSAAQTALGQNAEVYYAWGDHDAKSDISSDSGLLYSGDYYIYHISDMNMRSKAGATSDNVGSAISAFESAVASMDKTKILFIMTHAPLHARRNESTYAEDWYKAITAAAASMDVVVFWAHNHTGESDVDRAAYYVAKNGDETFDVEFGTEDVTPNFTYMNAGYIYAAGQNPTRKGVATTVEIYADEMVFQDYTSSGEYAVADYSHNVTVARAFATGDSGSTDGDDSTVGALSRIEVTTLPDKTTYDVGDELDTTGMVVTGYDDAGNSAEIDGWFTSSVDMTTAGEKEVTVTYMDNGIAFKTTFTITVVDVPEEEAVLESIEITALPETTTFTCYGYLDITGLEVTAYYSDGTSFVLSYDSLNAREATAGTYTLDFNTYTAGKQAVTVSYTDGDVTCTDTFDIFINVATENLTGSFTADVADSDVVAAAMAEAGLTSYTAYDMNLSEDGAIVENSVVKVAVDGEADYVVYYVSEDGTEVEKIDCTYADGVVTFTPPHFSIYVVGSETVEEDEKDLTLDGTPAEKTVYVLVSTPTAGNQYIIVSSNTAGSGYALKENTTTGTSVTINAATSSITAPYIETSDGTIIWNATSGLNFQSVSGGYYLNYSQSSSGGGGGGGGSNSYSLSFSTSSASDWTAGSNTLYRNGQNNDYYLRYNSVWTMGGKGTEYEVYFYEKQTITVDSSTTYTVSASDIAHIYDTDETTAETEALTYELQANGVATSFVGEVWSVAVVSDPDGIIDVENSTNTQLVFTGAEGAATVRIYYTYGDYKIWKTINVTAAMPYYALSILDGETDVTGTTIAKKGVTSTTTLNLGYAVTYVSANGEEKLTALPEGATLTWAIPEEYQNIATVDNNGVVTFKGVDGAFYVMATLTVNGKDYVAGVNISASVSSYSVPEDATNDFPEYPNEGAIRYDKTATAVGNFSETGIAQVELSMTGVPYTTGSEIDVVLMLDMTGSMSDTAMVAAEEAAVAFVAQIVKNEDGSYNDNRIAVYAFNSGSSSPYTLVDLSTIDSDSELATANTAIRTASDKKVSGGTPYDEALEKCQSVLAAAKTDGIGNNRQQFCVFMSDGGPTSYKYITNYDAVKAGTATAYTTSSASATGGSNQSDSNFATIATYTHEYYSTLMKDAGVTMFSVLTGLSASSYPNCATIMKNIASSSDNAYVVENGSDTSAVSGALSSVAQKILQAATDVTIEDQITDEYTMVFDIPTGSKNISGLDSQEFYIEFVEYTLDANHERTTNYTTLTKLYLGTSNGTYYAASDASGTAYAKPVFENKVLGEKGTLYYWTTDSSYATKAAVSYNDGTNTYYFIPYGIKATDDDYDSTQWFNMTSGAYASGKIDETTNMSENLVIATPYFVYNAATKMLYWTVEKIGTTEYALRYFLYLDKSATEIGTDNEVDSGPYPTNHHAYITYTNFNGNDCRQEFPIPQLTWNGAQVSYVFYLVNEAGQPINKSGQIVDFANATFVTDVFKHSVVWNGTNAVEELNVEYLASDLLPDDYIVYDENAEYTIHVYQTEAGQTVFDYFIIAGDTAANIATYLNSKLTDSELAEANVSIATTKVYNTKAGTKYSDYGTYSAEAVGTEFTTKDADGNTVTITTTKQASLDYSDTTVAFAVLWKPALVPDTVVVDFGLDVLINVVDNDLMDNAVTGIGLGNSAYGSIAMNTGVSNDSKLGTAALTTTDGSTISLENEKQIRFHQNDMTFETPVTFYYESPVNYYEKSESKEGYMYSSVTVIPATTVYYEDSYLTYSDNWSVDGSTVDATQAQDRPGVSQISKDLDADNNYGYDGAYTTMSGYSMGSAHAVTVNADNYATAEFEFYGTGFDVISLTSNATGSMFVDVYPMNGNACADTASRSIVIDTYYGYSKNEKGEWVLSENDPNALYQVPVIKVDGLTYGKYKAVLSAVYADLFDHNTTTDTAGNTVKSGSYTLYLDAIRIYDPTGVASGSVQNKTVSDAYVADGEGWPQYIEVRNKVINASDYTANANAQLNGAIFIDSNDENYSVADYVAYGPNNELYLDAGQSIAFNLDQTNAGIIADVQIGLKVGNGGAVSYKIYDSTKTDAADVTAKTLNTTNDMYYDIKNLSAGTIVVTNAGTSGILSITHVKVTYTQNPYGTSSSSEDDITTDMYMDETGINAALMSLRTASVEDDVVEETTTAPTELEETETKATEPEATESEATEPEEETGSAQSNVEKIVKTIVNKVAKTISSLFSKWFR